MSQALTEGIFNQLMEMARISLLSELASGIAHELNQPLGAIATFSQAGDRLLNRPDPMVARALEVFRQINSEALAAGDGIRRIRALFNQTGRDRVRSQMGFVVDELKPLLEVMANAAHIDFSVAIEGHCPDVAIEKLRIQHVIFALAQNAFDACRGLEGPGRVEIRVRSDRYAVEVGVSDSGVGIAETARELLFKPFFTTKPKGTGLGLASCRAIMETHEGTIGFERVSSGGSRFWFRLPIMPT